MTATGTDRPPRWALRLLDGVQYGVALTLVVTAAGVIVAYALALATRGPAALGSVDPLLAAKWLLFVVGFGAMALGTLKLRPQAPYKENSRLSLSLSDSDGDEGFAARVASLPPLGRYEPTRRDRLSGGGRLLVASGLMLLVSFLMETALGVGV